MTGPPAPSTRAFLAGAIAFGAVGLAMPLVAHAFRGPITGGGVVGLLTVLAVCLLALVLSTGCLVLLVRGHRRAIAPPDIDGLDPATPEPLRRLMQAFSFDAADLSANRDGTLSERQRANLSAHRRMAGIMAGLMLSCTYASLALMPLLMNQGSSVGSRAAADDRIGFLIGLGLVNALVMGSFLYGYWIYRDVVHGRMTVVEGTAGPAPASRVPSIAVGGLAVPVVNAAQQRAIEVGGRYRVSVVRAPMPLVLSIEPV